MLVPLQKSATSWVSRQTSWTGNRKQVSKFCYEYSGRQMFPEEVLRSSVCHCQMASTSTTSCALSLSEPPECSIPSSSQDLMDNICTPPYPLVINLASTAPGSSFLPSQSPNLSGTALCPTPFFSSPLKCKLMAETLSRGSSRNKRKTRTRNWRTSRKNYLLRTTSASSLSISPPTTSCKT